MRAAFDSRRRVAAWGKQGKTPDQVVEVKVKDPAVFKQVKANDKVNITYTEAVLLDVETPKK